MLRRTNETYDHWQLPVQVEVDELELERRPPRLAIPRPSPYKPHDTMSPASPLVAALVWAVAANGWSQVPIGGGGYVMEVAFSATSGDAYMRTDVGGMYRRVTAADGSYSWVAMMDWAPPSASELYSSNALALDPQDGTVLYSLFGPYWAYSNCTVWASSDGGATWVSKSTNGWGLRCGGNENDRSIGSRMSVHPVQRGTLAVGGSDGHVYLTTDAFASGAPTRLTLPAPAPAADCVPHVSNACVVRTVLWVPVAGGGVLLVAAVPNLGIFSSAGPDYTTGWRFVTGSEAPVLITRLISSAGGSPGRVWATANSGGIWSGVLTQDGSAVTWDVAGALADADMPFAGIAVRPNSSGADVVVMTESESSNTTLWRSLDAGATWTQLAKTVTSDVPWWNGYMLELNAAASLSWDPHAATPTLWATDFFGVYMALAPPAVTNLSFAAVEHGHEEACMNFVLAPAVGDVVSGAADVGAWVHDAGTAAYPTSNVPSADGWSHNCYFDAVVTLSLAPGNATADTLWITAGDEYGACHGEPSWCGLHSWVGVSRDGGKTFADTTWDSTYPVDQANPYRVVSHPFDGAKAVVVAREGLPVTFTRDFGKTWGNSTGIKSVGQQGDFWFAQPIVAELQIDADAPEAVFYFYNGTGGLFSSVDSGATFTPTYTQFPDWQVPFYGLAVPPRGAAAAGDLWAFAGWKIYHSVDAGATFSQAYSFYEIDHVLAVGPLPPTTAGASGRHERELATRCYERSAAAAVASGAQPLPPPRAPTDGGAAGYVVYAIGTHNYAEPTALYASIDAGHSWLQLSGFNSTPAQALGDSPYVLEASLSQPGTLYVGTGGRGAFVRDVAAELRAALLACED